MPVLKPRNKTVVFRLTQEEYETLRSVSATSGARNLSDFGRSLILGALGHQEQGESEVLQQICTALSGLQQAVEKMVDRFEELSLEKPLSGEARNP